MQFAYRQQPPAPGKTALRWGLILGLLHGIVSSLLTVLAATILIKVSGPLTLLSIPLACIFFFLAGFFAARQTRRVASGTLSGLLAGIISKILSTILVALFFFVYQLPRTPQFAGRAVSPSRLIPLFTLELLYLVLDIALGVGFGALGGRFGKGPSMEEEPLPTSMRSPAQPQQPPAPPIRPPQPPTPAEPPDSDPYPYGKPFFPPPYPVPPTQSRRPQ
jgi:hypothetical protein